MSKTDTSATESQEFITYYIETTDGMFRVNIPENWVVNMEFSRDRGSSVLTISDEKGNDRLFYANVQQIRDSATQIEELVVSDTSPNTPTDGNPAVFVWRTANRSLPGSQYAQETIELRSRRRRRISLQEDSIDIGENQPELDDGF